MSHMIPKNLFLVWIGDSIPAYAAHSYDAYKLANPDFKVDLVTFSLDDLARIYRRDICSTYDELLLDSIDIILSDDERYSQLLHKTFRFILSHQEVLYGREVRFIQLLSDIFRVQLVSKIGGIYVDCDTFPVKPFSNEILNLKKFVVMRHYNNQLSTTGIDNYFIGQAPGYDQANTAKVLQTDDKWWTSIKFLMRKREFFNCTLEYKSDLSSKFFIEHFCDGCWKNNNGIIRTPKCFLDDIYLASKRRSLDG